MVAKPSCRTIAMGGRHVEQQMRLHEVLLYTLAGLIKQGEVDQCMAVILFGGFAVPLGGLGVTADYAPADFIHDTEVKLCVGIPLFGAFAIPICCLCFVL